jgi:hypothetical protein
MSRKRVQSQSMSEPAPDDRKIAPSSRKDRSRRTLQGKSHKEHLDRLLDEALACTFPASDPISVS